MSCTKEEIERKRLAALQKRQSKVLAPNQGSSPYKSAFAASGSSFHSTAGPIKSFPSQTRNFHPYSKPGMSTSARVENKAPVGKVVTGTVYLISEDRFEVKPSEFCAPLINVFKSIPSKNYDGSSKLWNFSINDYQELMKKVAPLSPDIVLGTLPAYVLKVLNEQTMDPNNVDLSPIEATLRHKLMPFQQDGVRFGISRRGRCMIADDMGLGKTFQALAIASYYRHNWPLLIVTTSSMRETWQSKIHELLPSVPLMNIVTLTTGKDAQLVADRHNGYSLGTRNMRPRSPSPHLSPALVTPSEAAQCVFGENGGQGRERGTGTLTARDLRRVRSTVVVIVSYKITSMHTDLLKSKKFGVVIIDESHYLKSHKAQCTVALSGITRQCQRVVLLSGTPALSRPAELYTQLSLIEPNLFGSYTEYGKRYCDGKQTNFGWDMNGQSNLPELQIILQKRFLIRRTKEQVLTKLEQKTRETVLLDQSLLEFTKEDRDELSQMAENYKKNKSTDRHAALITYFSESARAKIPAVCKYIKQLLEETSEKFLIFAHHRNVVDAICLTLDERRVHYICIVGSTPANTRADLVDKFQHTPLCRCAVLSITAANSGLTLTAAGLVLFAELHWNPGILTQAESRAHRLGRRGGVVARYLLAPGTADDHMWPMLQDKLNVLNDVGLSKDTFEDTTTKHQESSINIAKYFSPIRRNPNNYIPGTNIRKDFKSNQPKDNPNTCDISKTDEEVDLFNGDEMLMDEFCENGDDSFFDEEGDELLANVDL